MLCLGGQKKTILPYNRQCQIWLIQSNVGIQTSAPMFECRLVADGCQGKSFLGCRGANLQQCNRSKKNHQKLIVIGQIIGSGKIDSFMYIALVLTSFSFSF